MTYSIPYSFIPGTKARAQEVNANFTYVLDSIGELNSSKLNASLSNITSTGINTIKNLTSFRNIGEVISSAIPLTDAGLHLLDGSLLAYASYKDFIDYIATIYNGGNANDCFCSESDWQAAVTANGVCGKFVYNSTNNTVRLPKYSNKIYTSAIENTAPVIGNGSAIRFMDKNSGGNLADLKLAPNSNGVMYSQNYGTSQVTGFASAQGIQLAQSNSGIVAQLSDITSALDGYYYIVVATSTQTDIQVDIDNIATDLNGKADKDLSNINASQSAKNTITEWGMPDYANKVLVASGRVATETSYTCPSKGWLYCLCIGGAQGAVATIKINDLIVIEQAASSSSYATEGTAIFPVFSGDEVKYLINYQYLVTNRAIYFVPMKGV